MAKKMLQLSDPATNMLAKKTILNVYNKMETFLRKEFGEFTGMEFKEDIFSIATKNELLSLSICRDIAEKKLEFKLVDLLELTEKKVNKTHECAEAFKKEFGCRPDQAKIAIELTPLWSNQELKNDYEKSLLLIKKLRKTYSFDAIDEITAKFNKKHNVDFFNVEYAFNFLPVPKDKETEYKKGFSLWEENLKLCSGLRDFQNVFRIYYGQSKRNHFKYLFYFGSKKIFDLAKRLTGSIDVIILERKGLKYKNNYQVLVPINPQKFIILLDITKDEDYEIKGIERTNDYFYPYYNVDYNKEICLGFTRDYERGMLVPLGDKNNSIIVKKINSTNKHDKVLVYVNEVPAYSQGNYLYPAPPFPEGNNFLGSSFFGGDHCAFPPYFYQKQIEPIKGLFKKLEEKTAGRITFNFKKIIC